jgi:hypothetical protein
MKRVAKSASAAVRRTRCGASAALASRLLAPVLASLVFVGTTLPAAAQISVDDLELHLGGGAGRLQGVLQVRNDGATIAQVAVSLGDWSRDEDGSNQFGPAGTMPRSCGDELVVDQTTLRIEPRGTALLNVSIGSAAVARGCWSIVMLETEERRDAATTTGLHFTVRTGVKVYVHQAGAVAGAELEPVGVDRDEDGRYVARALLHNTGGTHLIARGTLDLRDAAGALVTRLPVADLYTLPLAKRRLAVTMPELQPGRYVALLLIDYGGDELVAAQLAFLIEG